MCAPRAFSLIELIVVISVAVLLTGLLMPAMRLVHENAHRVMCMANLQQIGSAMIVYGGEHNDYLPRSQVLHVDNLPQNLMASRRGGPNGHWDGLGILFADHYCGAAECFYCPSHHGNHPFERYANAWNYPIAGLPMYTNYHYAGDIEWGAEGRRRSLDQGHRLVLATDGLRTATDFNHNHGMNVLRADGSVRWRDDTDDILELLPKNENEPIHQNYINLWDVVAAPQ